MTTPNDVAHLALKRAADEQQQEENSTTEAIEKIAWIFHKFRHEYGVESEDTAAYLTDLTLIEEKE